MSAFKIYEKDINVGSAIIGNMLVNNLESDNSSGGTSPDTLDLFVSNNGSDQNEGTSSSPLLSLKKAINKVKDTGYNKSSSITIDSSGGDYDFTLDESFVRGAKGCQENELIIQGSGKTIIYSGSVTNVTVRDTSLFLEIETTAGAGLTSADIGKFVQFTSGILSGEDNITPIVRVLAENIFMIPINT